MSITNDVAKALDQLLQEFLEAQEANPDAKIGIGIEGYSIESFEKNLDDGKIFDLSECEMLNFEVSDEKIKLYPDTREITLYNIVSLETETTTDNRIAEIGLVIKEKGYVITYWISNLSYMQN